MFNLLKKTYEICSLVSIILGNVLIVLAVYSFYRLDDYQLAIFQILLAIALFISVEKTRISSVR